MIDISDWFILPWVKAQRNEWAKTGGWNSLNHSDLYLHWLRETTEEIQTAADGVSNCTQIRTVFSTKTKKGAPVSAIRAMSSLTADKMHLRAKISKIKCSCWWCSVHRKKAYKTYTSCANRTECQEYFLLRPIPVMLHYICFYLTCDVLDEFFLCHLKTFMAK